MLSSIFIYAYERGNLIQLTVVLSTIFLLCYNSKNKIIKEISFICLATAAALKIFPALFGILLLFDKKYKEAMRLIIYGINFTSLPFLFFEGD